MFDRDIAINDNFLSFHEFFMMFIPFCVDTTHLCRARLRWARHSYHNGGLVYVRESVRQKLARTTFQPCIIGFPSYWAHMFTMMIWNFAHKTQACTSKVNVTLRGQRSKLETMHHRIPKLLWRTRLRPVPQRRRSHLEVKGRNDKCLIHCPTHMCRCVKLFLS